MKKISRLIERMNHDTKIPIVCLVPLTLLFGYNEIVDYFISAIFILIACFFTLENNFYFLIFFSIFDEVLTLDIINGSIFRFVMIIYFIKLGIYFIKEKKFPISLNHLAVIAFCGIFMLIGFINSGLSFASLMIFVNIVLIISYGTYLKANASLDRMMIYKNIVYTIIFSVAVACFYGILHLNFLIEASHKYQIARFNGIFEPNFMCTYANLALVFVLVNEDMFSKRAWNVMVAFFTIFACLTVSMSGVALLGIIYLVYLFHKKKDFFLRFKHAITVFLISVFSFFVINSCVNVLVSVAPNLFTIPDNVESDEFYTNKKPSEGNVSSGNPLVLRFEALYKDIRSGNWASLTSGRTSLVSEFYKASVERSTDQVLFGNGLDAKTVYSKTFGKQKYSHNTYIDFIYCFGAVGSIIIMIYLARKTIKGTFLELTDNNIPIKMRLIRLTVLFSALTLTLYSRRLFMLLFLI